MPDYILPYIHPTDMDSYFHGFIVACFFCAFVAFILWASEFINPKIIKISIPKPAATMEEALEALQKKVNNSPSGTLIPVSNKEMDIIHLIQQPPQRDAKGRFVKRRNQ